MTPLNLTRQPPRPPHDALDGVVFLPRSIDKFRATLPGGALGEYQIEGLTQTMLDQLGIPADAFGRAVADAADDGEVARFVRTHCTPASLDAWNAFVAVRQPRGGNRVEALTVFPWLDERPDLVLALDIIAEDDKRSFANA